MAEDLPERIHSEEPNYITAAGEQALQDKLVLLREKRASLDEDSEHLGKKGDLLRIDRDITYFQERLRRAIIVEQSPPPHERVLFGTTICLEDDKGEEFEFTLVGEDETDLDAGKICWHSPLGKTLMQGELNETVTWSRPAGELELEIVSISYKNS